MLKASLQCAQPVSYHLFLFLGVDSEKKQTNRNIALVFEDREIKAYNDISQKLKRAFCSLCSVDSAFALIPKE